MTGHEHVTRYEPTMREVRPAPRDVLVVVEDDARDVVHDSHADRRWRVDGALHADTACCLTASMPAGSHGPRTSLWGPISDAAHTALRLLSSSANVVSA